MSIGLNLWDNGIGSFISVFWLVWIFFFSLRIFPDFGCMSHIHLKLLKCFLVSCDHF